MYSITVLGDVLDLEELSVITSTIKYSLGLEARASAYGSSLIIEVIIPFTDYTDIEDTIREILRILRNQGYRRILRRDLIPGIGEHRFIVKVRK